MSDKPLRVAVLSPHHLVRAGLTTMIHSEPGRAVVIDIASADGHLGHQDVTLYDLEGITNADRGRDLEHLVAGGKPVVGLARLHQGDLADGAGPLGIGTVIVEDISRDELLDVLERATGRAPARRRDKNEGHLALTERETTVLRLIAAGHSNKEIAAALYVSINSVKTYIRASYQKIGVSRRPQAVLWAFHHGLAPRDPDAVPDAP